MKKIIIDGLIQVEQPSTDEQYFEDVVEAINDLYHVFNNEGEYNGYDIDGSNFTENQKIRVKTENFYYEVEITNEGQIDDCLVELTFNVECGRRGDPSLYFLEW